MSLARFLFRLLLGRRLPVTTGSARIAGLHGRVLIHRDKFGIPMIEADDPRDGPFAIGFCQGQDRSFQLEVLLRVARGIVSEMAGPAALPVDRLSRRIGFHHAASRQLPHLHADIRDAIQAYAAGVEAGRTVGSSRPAHEFALTGIRHTVWTATDTLALTKMLSFTLCSNWDAEIVRLKVLTSDGPEALAALDAAYPESHPVLVPVGALAGKVVDRLAADLAAFFSIVKPGGGSNNWVLAGSKSQSGRPLLACDPHLSASHPAHWYLLNVRTPREQLCGASFVGGPVVLAGHNGHAAWGLTAGLVDNTDLFIEEIGPNGTSVRQGEEFVPCEVREEVIKVKGGEPVVERVLVTPRGPIISPALIETPEALSMRGTWLDPLPIVGFFRMGAVRSYEEFRSLFTDWPASSQNLVYADTRGDIGYQLIGRAPVRKMGHGLMPLPGRDPGVGWEEEPIPFEQMPHLKNPTCGYIATANTRHTPEGEGPYLGSDFIDGYRQMAILQALKGRDGWDVAATMALQMDQHTAAWAEMRDVVLGVPTKVERWLQDELRNWDGCLRADSAAALIYEMFLARMIISVAKAKAPNSWRWVVGAGLSPITPYNFGCFRRTSHLVRLMKEQPAGWFKHSWPEEIANNLERALDEPSWLQAEQIRTALRITWGQARKLVLHHPLSKAPGWKGRVLGSIFNLGPVPCGGDCDSINQAGALPLCPLAPSDNIVSLRVVIDVGAWHNSRFVLPGGQSGNPLSPHYGDLFPLWQKGEGVPIAFTPDEVKAATVQMLELTPG